MNDALTKLESWGRLKKTKTKEEDRKWTNDFLERQIYAGR